MPNISTWDKLDYERNAVIEASAGTGKTYTIEHIVEKLVREKGVDIRNILLVTFTEKAAGELKERIRHMFAETEAARHLDEATICTIHSFCREILASYPFESGMMMGMDIGGSDAALCEKAVHNVLVSEEFQESLSCRFPALMEYWSTDGDSEDVASASTDKLIDAVKKDNLTEWQQEYNTLIEKSSWLIEAIGRLPGAQEGGPGAYVMAHTANGSTFRCRRDWNKAHYNFFSQLDDKIRVVKDQESAPSDLISAIEFIANGNFHFELYKLDGVERNTIFCELPGYEVYAEVKELAAAKARVLREEIIQIIVAKAYPEFLRLKLQSGNVTFDDLIKETARLVEAATDPGATNVQKAFVKRMRERYRLAMVDEFQDTDAKQWQIFRNLFASIGRLIVVGDPKQAIYGWRGADLATYMSAKTELCENGQFESLCEMYRSTEKMVDDFNTIFSSGWFRGMESGGKPIEYEKVLFPIANPPAKVKDFQYSEGEEAVELLEAKGGFEEFVANAANEMIRLNTEWEHHMDWGDMCVLVRSNDDACLVQRLLQGKKIPCRFYHERGFFAGEEAESVLALLDYLSMPRGLGNLSALLLSPIFGFDPYALSGRLENGDAKFDRLCERWRNYAAKHDWIRLFESVMQETNAANKPSGFRQVFDQLLRDYGRSNTTAELAAALRALKNGDVTAGENGNIRNKESEAPAVQIMTMHAAKGLEFNAVFVAGGFAGVSNHCSNDNRTKKERSLEICRLFYVALTRATFKLYLPWSRNVPIGGLGKRGSALREYMGAAIKVLCKGDVESRMRDPGERKIDETVIPDPEVGERPPRLGMKGWRFKWDSFSSLCHHAAPKPEEVEGVKAKDDELSGSAGGDEGQSDGIDAMAANGSLVPKGALSGTVFHEVMEKLCQNDKEKGEIDFSIGQNDDFESLVDESGNSKSPLLEIVRRRLAANGVVNKIGAKDGESTAVSIARMAWNALRTEVDIGGDKFKLCDVGLADRKAEVNFVFDENLFKGGSGREGALNGSIDLVVRRSNGKYVIVDWKTNALENYSPESVKSAMDAAGYHNQYQIYTLAAEKWLGAGSVAGAAYLFVRGGEFGERPSGVFACLVKAEDRERFLESLVGLIGISDRKDEEREEEGL